MKWLIFLAAVGCLMMLHRKIRRSFLEITYRFPSVASASPSPATAQVLAFPQPNSPAPVLNEAPSPGLEFAQTALNSESPKSPKARRRSSPEITPSSRSTTGKKSS